MRALPPMTAAVASGCLLMSLIALPAAGADLQPQGPSSSQEQAAELPKGARTALGGRQTSDFEKSQLPAFAPQLKRIAVARAGGRGTVRLTIPRTGAPGVNVERLVVKLSVPAPATFGEAGVAPGPRVDVADPSGRWQCTQTDRGQALSCGYLGDLTSGRVPVELQAHVRPGPQSAGQIRVTGTARWVEDKVKRGHDGLSGQDPTNGQRDQSVPVTSTVLEVDPALEVKARGFGTGEIFVDPDGPDEQRMGHLLATIGGHSRRTPVAVQWEQVGGPKVTFVSPTSRTAASRTVTADYVVPQGVPDGTVLEFRLEARSAGTAASDTATVAVRSTAVTKLDPHTEQVATALRASSQVKKSHQGVKIPRRDYANRIGKAGPRYAKADRRVLLRFNSAHGVRRVDWSLRGAGPKRWKPRVRRTASTYAFTTPDVRAPRRFVLTGVATLDNGARVQRSELIFVAPDVKPVKHKTKKRKKKVTKTGLRVAASNLSVNGGSVAQPSGTQVFCGLKAGSTVKFDDGATLELPNGFTAAKKCGASTPAVAFAGATFTYGGTELGDAAGLISPAGVTITEVVFEVPKSLQPFLPASVANAELGLSVPADSGVAVSAPFGGEFTGTFASDTSLNFLPTPTGWTSPQTVATVAFIKGKPVLTVTATSQATDGSGGQVSFSTAVAGGQPGAISVQATDVVIIQSASGNQWSASGTGAFTAGASPQISLQLDCLITDANGNCPLLSNLSIGQNTTIDWNASGLSIPGASVTVGGYSMTLAGDYGGVGDWSLSVQSAAPWVIGSTGVSLTGLRGSISEAQSGSGSAMTVDISSDVTGLAFASYLGSPTIAGSIANTCPQNATSCTAGQVVVGISAMGSAVLDTVAEPVPYTASAVVDLNAMTFDLDASASVQQSFGPSEFGVDSFTVTLSSAVGGGNDDVSLALTGTGAVWGNAVALTAYFSESEEGGSLTTDYYVVGSISDFSNQAFASDAVTLGYSSFDTSVTLPNSSVPTDLSAGVLFMTGDYQLPASVSESLGDMAGTATFTATADPSADTFTADVAYNLSNQPVIVGNAASTDLTLTSVSMSATVSDGLTVSLVTGGSVNTVIDSGPPLVYDSTPVAGAITATVGSGSGASIDLSLGVDTAVLPPTTCADGNTADVCDAFGQAGLDLDDLSIGGTFSVDPSVSFNASAYLPAAWTSGILENDPQVSLAFDISMETPCIEFAIGSASSTTNVIDIGGGDTVTGTYLNLVLAPFGCQLATVGGAPTVVDPGLAFNFDGAIFGASTTVNLAADIGTTGITISGDLDIAAFTVASVNVQDTTVSFDIDTGAPKYQVSFSGGVQVGTSDVGGLVTVSGEEDLSESVQSFELSGQGDLDLSDLAASVTDFDISANIQNGVLTSAQISGNMSVSVLGVSLNGSVGLAYADGELLQFHVAVGATLDFYVGEVGGDVFIDYCVGALGAEPTNASSCQTSSSGEVQFEVYFEGQFRVGVCGNHWYDVCYSTSFSDVIVQVGGNSPQPSPSMNAPLFLSNPGNVTQFAQNDASDFDLDLMFDQSSYLGTMVSPAGTQNTVLVSAVAPVGLDESSWTVPGCSSPESAITWSPKSPKDNPAANNAVPQITGTCAIQIVYSFLPQDDTLQAGDYGTSPVSSAMQALIDHAAAGTSDTVWATPQTGYAVCFPDGVSQWIGDAHCEIYDSGVSSQGYLIGGASTPAAPDYQSPFTQIQLGTLTPLGAQQSGLTLELGGSTPNADGSYGQALWSPTGDAVLMAGTYPNNPGCIEETDVCGYVAVKTGSDYPVAGNTLQLNVGGLDQYPETLAVDAISGAVQIGLEGGGVIEPNNAQVSVSSGQQAQPYLYVNNGTRLWSGDNCAPVDLLSSCGSVGTSNSNTDSAEFSLVSSSSGYCITAPELNTQASPMATMPCNGQQNQQLWMLSTVFTPSGGSMTIGSSQPIGSGAGPGSCVDVWKSGTSWNTMIDNNQCNGTDAQKFVWNFNGTVSAVNAPGMCLSEYAGQYSSNGRTYPTLILSECSTATQWSRQYPSNF